jgi:hypothetical protein
MSPNITGLVRHGFPGRQFFPCTFFALVPCAPAFSLRSAIPFFFGSLLASFA